MGPKERAARLIQRGDQLRAAGDSVSALAFYRDAISAAPRDVNGYLALGRAYSEVSELSRAIEVFQVGVRYAGEHTELLLAWIAAYERNGAPSEALTLSRALAFAHANEPRLAAEHARLCAQLGRFGEALAARRSEARWRRRLGDTEGYEQARAQARALELLVASSDRVAASSHCRELQSSIRRALAHCE